MCEETQLVSRFFVRARARRFLVVREDSRKRRRWLDKLNHDPGFDSRHVEWLPKHADVLALLRKEGAPDEVCLISASPELDGATMRLADALRRTWELGYGTVIGCVPGRLAYYYGELGERHAVLRRR